MPPHGYRKLAAGAVSGFTLAPVIIWLWNAFVVPLAATHLGLDATMPQEVSAQLGTLIALAFFERTEEQQVIPRLDDMPYPPPPNTNVEPGQEDRYAVG